MRKAESFNLYKNHKDLWGKLLELEDMPNKVGDIWNTLTKVSIHDLDKKYKQEEKEEQLSLFDE